MLSKAETSKRWREKNPNYMKEYSRREKHPHYGRDWWRENRTSSINVGGVVFRF